MAWIELHQSLLTHHKTIALSLELELPEIYAASHMVALWLWALDNAQDGDLTAHRPAVIARAAQWPGDPEAFVRAAVSAGYLRHDGDTLTIHDWYDYVGRLVEKREANARRMREARSKHENAESANGDGTNKERAAHVQRTSRARAGATVPNRTVPNQPEKKDGGGTTKRACEETAAPISVLDLGDEVGAVDLVREAMRQFPDLRHGYEARKCREHYRDWARLDGKARAGRYVKWLEKAQLFQTADAAKFNGPPRASPADELPWLPDDPDDEARVRKWDEDLKAQAKTRGSKHG